MTNSGQANLSQALTDSVTDKRVTILRAVLKTGSISEAARQVGVSYKSAWQAIETLTNLAGTALVEKAVGGAGGGGARLTRAGEGLLLAADQWLQLQREWLDRVSKSAVLGQEPLLPSARASPMGLAMQTSMRNQWPVTVKACQADQGRVRVALCLSDGQQLWAQITPESRQLLDLMPGAPVLAMCKANAVSVSDCQRFEKSTGDANRLVGRLNRLEDQAGASHTASVSVLLATDVALIGYWQDDFLPSANDRVAIEIDECAIVIAR